MLNKISEWLTPDEDGKTAMFVAIGHVPNSQAFTPALEVDEGGYFVAGANTVSTRHNNGFNALFADGHVIYLKTGDVPADAARGMKMFPRAMSDL